MYYENGIRNVRLILTTYLLPDKTAATGEPITAV